MVIVILSYIYIGFRRFLGLFTFDSCNDFIGFD